MRRWDRIGVWCLALSLVFGASRLGAQTRITPPVRTSIGDLVSIERRDSITTNDTMLRPKSDEVLYVLLFEGMSAIPFEGDVKAEGPYRVALIDAQGKRFAPAFAGSPTKEGTISDKGWGFTGSMKGAPQGGWVFMGNLNLPVPRVALVYVLPASASGLTLRDGDRQHPLPPLQLPRSEARPETTRGPSTPPSSSSPTGRSISLANLAHLTERLDLTQGGDLQCRPESRRQARGRRRLR